MNSKDIFKISGRNGICIYGIGLETEKELPRLKSEFRVVGLLDSFRESGSIYGEKIITLQEAADHGVKLIIVIARPGSCSAIAANIGGFCKKNNIALFDIRGNNLLEIKKASYRLDGYKGITKAELIAGAENFRIISFDLFDTLVMRKTLYPSDTVELVDMKLKKRGISIKNFFKDRMRAEMEMSAQTAPTLEEIYSRASFDMITAEELSDLEFETDLDLLIPRREMVSLLDEFRASGKIVCITTDTYYTKDRIIKILEKNGISCYDELFISCEEKCTKSRGLFDIVKSKMQSGNILHIGDDVISDIRSASVSGISSVKISGAREIFEHCGSFGIASDSLASRVKIGFFISRILNSPFLHEGNNLCVCSAYDIGYMFLAPILSDFVFMLSEETDKKDIKNIWFTARDGYLIKKLFDILRPDNSSLYFLTSRFAAVRAGMESNGDVKYISDLKFSGTIRQQLKMRFGIDAGDAEGRSLYDFSDEILKLSGEYRSNCLKYISKLPVYTGDIAFMDFVARGTTQMFVDRLIDNRLYGLYFLQIDKEFMNDHDLDIKAFFDGEESLYDNYFILETVLTSPEPTVTGFDGNGEPQYGEETRTQEDIDCVLEIQKGIENYFSELLLISDELIDKKADIEIFDLIHKFDIRDKRFENMNLEDPFFNRKTSLKVLL